MLPELPPAAAAQVTLEEYAARVLARVGEAAWREYSQGGGLLVNYTELPEAVRAPVVLLIVPSLATVKLPQVTPWSPESR